MAYTDDYKAGKPVKINTIIEAVNSQLKNKIQSKIYYWRNNMPSGFPSEWRYLFSDKNTLPELKCDTTYSIILARLFNLSYVDFLKYAVKNYNATIVDSKYPYVVFTNSKDCDALVKELNKRWELIEKYRQTKNIG